MRLVLCEAGVAPARALAPLPSPRVLAEHAAAVPALGLGTVAGGGHEAGKLPHRDLVPAELEVLHADAVLALVPVAPLFEERTAHLEAAAGDPHQLRVVDGRLLRQRGRYTPPEQHQQAEYAGARDPSPPACHTCRLVVLICQSSSGT